MDRWQKNLTVIWFAQFLSITAFAFSMPFAPYFMQELGVTDEQELKRWVALFAAATPLALAIFSPIWGAMADRFGRRLMMLRAQVGAAVVLTLMGTVESVTALIILRLCQGAFTGTVTAAQTMVASQTPSDKAGFALGSLSAAIFSGGMTGAFLGGTVAHFFGYRVAFYIGGAIQVATTLLIFFGTREDFKPAPAHGIRDLRRIRRRFVQLAVAFPILALMVAIAFVRQFDLAFMPLLVQEINGSLAGVSLWAGAMNGVGGLAGIAAGLMTGRLADRVPASTLVKVSSLGAAVMMVVQSVAYSFALLLPARFLMIFCSGALDPAVQTWLAKTTPEDRRGYIFGWAGSARAIGWVLAPLVSGFVATHLGIRPIFLFGAVLFLLLVPVIALVLRTQRP